MLFIQEKDMRFFMFLRLVMIFLILFTITGDQRSAVYSVSVTIKAYFIIFINFFITSVFLFSYKRIENLSRFSVVQIIYDVLFTTILIALTGPFESIYMVFYLLNIIFSAILFRMRGALATAILSSIAYVFIAAASPEAFMRENLYSIFSRSTAFVAVGLLSGQFIEELRKSRQKINRLEELNEEIVNSLDSGLLGIDKNGIIQKINRTASELLGIRSPHSAIGKQVREVFPALGEIFFIKPSNAIKELMIRGKMKRMLITQVDLTEGNSMVLLRDLTEVLDLEKKIQRQEQLASIGRLAATIAHEIRNPIASISGSAQLLGSQIKEDLEKTKLTEIMVRESERVDNLISQLLRFAKPLENKRERVDVSLLLEECVSALAARQDYQKLNIKTSLNVPSNLDVSGSKDQLREVLDNLLVNAVQAFSNSKKSQNKELNISAKKEDGFIEISVRDNGPGIPTEFREKIFDPFFTTKTYGTGLGLAQVHKIIREHDGTIDVESEEGRGTAMRVRIPA